MTIRRQLLNFGTRTTDVRLGGGALDEASKLFSGAVGKPCRAVLIHGAYYEPELIERTRRSLVDAGFAAELIAVDAKERYALADAAHLLSAFDAASITREDLVVGLGDAALCSLAGLCARMWLGGVTCALVPTTLDAMVTCATAMEPLAVADGAKGAGSLSLMPEPALVVCDLDFACAAPVDRNGMGLVRLVAAHLCESRKAWTGFATLIDGLNAGSEPAYCDALGMAFTSRLNTVKSASPAARKAFAYGETTAAALRRCLGGEVPAYRLLAEGLRFEARLGVDVFDFSVDAMFEQDDYLEDLGIEELRFELDPAVFIDALREERLRVSNRFQIALPKNLGIIRQTGVDDEVLERHAKAFLDSRRP